MTSSPAQRSALQVAHKLLAVQCHSLAVPPPTSNVYLLSVSHPCTRSDRFSHETTQTITLTRALPVYP